MKKVMVVGGGGREDCIVWKILDDAERKGKPGKIIDDVFIGHGLRLRQKDKERFSLALIGQMKLTRLRVVQVP